MSQIQFPKSFVWGAATAAYQIEGGYNEDGRGMSIWDTFSRQPGKVFNMDNGDVACDSYHRYDEDVALLKQLGAKAYRFSVAWPRIIPDGDGEINRAGLDYYHKLVDELIANGLEPYCTLYHWDLPQALQDRGGWDNRETIEAFVRYAEVMFKEFGGKIKHWITLNEPWCVSFLSNYIGAHAPGEQDLQLAVNISHHLMVAHGKAVQKFRELGTQGVIGYAPNTEWNFPYTNKPEDIEACRRSTGYFIDWFFDPVFKGEYPDYLVEWYGKKGVTVPILEGDLQTINQPIDFLGINYYTSFVGRYQENDDVMHVEKLDVGYEKTDIGWNIVPEGFYAVLTYVKERYGDIPIYITENGSCYNEGPGIDAAIHDEGRIRYLHRHLIALHRAMESGVNVQGYFAWSLLDNFEWAFGYSMRFGIVYTDYETMERIPKDSYRYLQRIIANGGLDL